MKQELSPAIDDFARWRKSQDFSKGTLRGDAQVLKRFLAVNGNIWCHAITERHVERHFELASRTRTATSLTNDHQVLGQFFKWARHTGRMPVDADPMFGRRRPRITKRERNRVAVTDFPRLLEVAGDREPRDRALIACLLYTLVRDSEARDWRIRDVDLQGGWLNTRIHKSRLEDRIPISSELDGELRKWLTHYTERVGELKPHYYLLPARAVHPVHNEHGRITHHGSTYRPEKNLREAGRIVRPHLERIGFPVVDEDGKKNGEGAHTLRRSGARALFDTLVEGGYDHAIRIVQSMLHHKSMAQTEVYVGITADRRSRDDLIKGQIMFPGASASNVVSLAR